MAHEPQKGCPAPPSSSAHQQHRGHHASSTSHLHLLAYMQHTSSHGRTGRYRAGTNRHAPPPACIHATYIKSRENWQAQGRHTQAYAPAVQVQEVIILIRLPAAGGDGLIVQFRVARSTSSGLVASRAVAGVHWCLCIRRTGQPRLVRMCCTRDSHTGAAGHDTLKVHVKRVHP